MDFSTLLNTPTLFSLLDFFVMFSLCMALGSKLRGTQDTKVSALFLIIVGIIFTGSSVPFLFTAASYGITSPVFILITIVFSALVGFLLLRSLTGSWTEAMKLKLATYYIVGIAISLFLTYASYYIETSKLTGY